jgi:hypothetical protein
MRLVQWFGVLVAVAIGTVAVAVPAAAKADRPESCRLLRAAEITQALSQPAAGGAPGHAPLVCDWSLAPTDSRPAGAISVYLMRGDTAADDFDLAHDFHRDGRIKLRGLGQRAFYTPSYDAVYVLKDPGTVLVVQGLYPADATIDPTGLQSALVALAGKASRRV